MSNISNRFCCSSATAPPKCDAIQKDNSLGILGKASGKLLSESVNYKWIALLLFFIGSVTDALDGYIARAYDLVSEFGKNVDPFADKIFILSALFTLYFLIPVYVPLWMILTVVFRDILVTSIRLISSKQKIYFQTSNFAKLKTIIQSVVLHMSMLILILYNYFNINLNFIYYLMLLSTLVTFATGIDYIRLYFKYKND